MERKQVIEILKEIVLTFVEQCDDYDTLELGENDVLLSGEYELDSIALVSIIVEIERQFDIIIDDEYLTFDFLSTIGDMADFVLEAIAEQHI